MNTRETQLYFTFCFQRPVDGGVSWQLTCQSTRRTAYGWAMTAERAVIQATTQAEAMLRLALAKPA